MKTSEKIVASAAVFISLCALFVSIYQTRILSQEKDASVWPYLQIKTSWNGDSFSLDLANDGIGPALIKDVSYTYKDSTFYFIQNLATYCFKDLAIDPDSISFGYTNVESQGSVVRGAETKKLLFVSNFPGIMEPTAEMFYATDIKIEYCSIYDQCWLNENNEITKK